METKTNKQKYNIIMTISVGGHTNTSYCVQHIEIIYFLEPPPLPNFRNPVSAPAVINIRLGKASMNVVITVTHELN